MPRRKFLKQEPVENLISDFLEIIHAHYLKPPPSRERVMEVLNALALVVDLVVDGTEDDAALAFFHRALDAARKVRQEPESCQ